MYPHERSLVKQLTGKPFALIGVNSDQDLEQIRSIVKQKNITWRSFQNAKGANGEISREWGVGGWPTLYIIDQNGVIRANKIHGAKQIDHMITKLLKDMGHEVHLSHEKNEPSEKDRDTDRENLSTLEDDHSVDL